MKRCGWAFGFSRVLRRWWFGLLTLQPILSPLPQAMAGNRVVAWGDIQYDMVLSCPGAPTGQPVKISAGDFHSLALRADGSVAAWGDNRFNQTNLPPMSTAASGIAAGNIHNLALMPDGTVVAWGPAAGQSGDYGQCTV